MRLAALDRKLVRDLLAMKGQAAAIGLVLAAGVAMFVAYLSNFDSLLRTQAAYYDRYRFAEVFASCKRAPGRLEERISEIGRRVFRLHAGRGRRDPRRTGLLRAREGASGRDPGRGPTGAERPLHPAGAASSSRGGQTRCSSTRRSPRASPLPGLDVRGAAQRTAPHFTSWPATPSLRSTST